jgi:hypothetical protein
VNFCSCWFFKNSHTYCPPWKNFIFWFFFLKERSPHPTSDSGSSTTPIACNTSTFSPYYIALYITSIFFIFFDNNTWLKF